MSQDHNTSNGLSNKFIYLSNTELEELLKNNTIFNFLEENNYI